MVIGVIICSKIRFFLRKPKFSISPVLRNVYSPPKESMYQIYIQIYAKLKSNASTSINSTFWRTPNYTFRK